MDIILYQGITYKRVKTHWVDENNIMVSEALSNYLNHMEANSIDLSKLSIQELVDAGDQMKNSASYTLAIKYYEKATVQCDKETLAYILPRISACYRKCHRSQDAIRLFAYAKKKFGADMITPALLTTAAAAYCDMKEYENARKCCDRAYALGNGSCNPYLSAVYRRIEKEKTNL